MGVISQVDGLTDWTSELVVVHKASGKLCIGIDPQQLNKALKHQAYQIPTVEDLLPEIN